MSAVAMLAAASCNKPELENIDKAPELGAKEFVAYTEAPTKTQLNGLATEWEEGDVIDINGVPFVTNETGTKAIFKIDDDNSEFPEAPYIAGYPYNFVYGDANGNICFNFCNEHRLVKGEICDEVLAVAYSESDRTLEFNNVTSLVKFTIPEFAEQIDVITFSTNEQLAGDVVINLDDFSWSPVVGDDASSYNEIVVKSSEGFTPGETYYVPVLPGKKTNLTVKINDKIVATGISIQLKRNVIHNIAVLPSALKWAVAGEFNGWNTSATPLVKDGDYYVARNITKLNSGNGFKFIKDGVWRGAEGETAVNEWVYVWGDGNNISVTGATEDTAYDIYVNPSAGDYGKFVIVPAGSEMPKDVPAWAIAGSFNGWDITATPMVKEGDFYVAKNISGLNYTEDKEDGEGSSTGFKFVTYGTDWKGSVGKMTTNTWQYVWDTDNGDNIYVEGAAATTLYDIYVNPSEGNNGKFVIVPAGESVPEDKPAGPVAGIDSEWAVYGQFGTEVWTEVMMKTTSDANIFVVKDKTMSAYNKFLIKKFDDDEWTVKYGSVDVNYIKSNKCFTVGLGGGDIFVEGEGIYDIYFDFTNTKVYLMEAGTNYAEAIEQIESGDAPVVEKGTKLYLKPNSNWKIDNARFAVYTWDGGDQWFDMTDSDGDGIYEVLIPDGVSNIIFCRMNPNAAANGWNNKWNQTGNLTIPTDGKNLFTVPNNAWDGSTSTWSVKK